MTIAELEEWLDDLGATVQITRRKIQRPRWVARVFFPGAERPMARAEYAAYADDDLETAVLGAVEAFWDRKGPDEAPPGRSGRHGDSLP